MSPASNILKLTTLALLLAVVRTQGDDANNTTESSDTLSEVLLSSTQTAIPPQSVSSLLPLKSDENLHSEEPPDELLTSNDNSTKLAPLLGSETENDESSFSKISSTYEDVSASVSVEMPMNCSSRDKLKYQPVQTPSSRLRKCCPLGENFFSDDTDEPTYCEVGLDNYSFDPVIVNAVLYDKCIEDTEEIVELETLVGNPCNISMTYSRQAGDRIFVLQDGSLLVMDEYGNESFAIHSDYCLDTDYRTGEIYAIVCMSSVDDHLSRGQTILFAAFMLTSIPCLIAVSFFHFAIRELRTVHGLVLGCLSSSLAIGFFLHSVAQLSGSDKSVLGYYVQFFMLSYFFWLLALCSNVVMNVWVYIRLYIPITRKLRYSHLAFYWLVSLSIPLALVLVTREKGLPGMPSYFFQGFTESIIESQRYFIPPVTFILLTCFILLVAAFFGFRHLENVMKTRDLIQYSPIAQNGADRTGRSMPAFDRELYQETKKDAKCIAFLNIIIITTWILEVVTFYSPGPEDYLAFMEIVNGLQGVFILMIFIIIRRRRNVIIRWWYDRGSHTVTEIEMQPKKKQVETAEPEE